MVSSECLFPMIRAPMAQIPSSISAIVSIIIVGLQEILAPLDKYYKSCYVQFKPYSEMCNICRNMKI